MRWALQERAQLDCQLCDTSVVVQMDNSRDLDMEGIIKSVECCYEEIAQKSKAEVEAFYQTRVSVHTTITGGNGILWATKLRCNLTPTPVCTCSSLLKQVMLKNPNPTFKLRFGTRCKTRAQQITALLQRGPRAHHPLPKGQMVRTQPGLLPCLG